MSEFELITLIRETSSTISQDFQFFITVTFAVIVAVYAAGDRLADNVRSGAALPFNVVAPKM